MTFQRPVKSKNSNRVQFSQLVNVRFLQCNQRKSSLVPSNLYRECNTVSLVQLHQISTASQTNSNSTLSSTTSKSEGESPSKFCLKLGSKNQLDQPSGLRISYLTTTTSKITKKDSTDYIRFTGLDQSSSKLQLRVITTVLQQYNSIYISMVLTQYNFIVNKYDYSN